MRSFSTLPSREWDVIVDLLSGQTRHWGKVIPRLKPVSNDWANSMQRGSIEGELIGGNLAVWASLIGTPFESGMRFAGKGSKKSQILFLEDVDEAPYRSDRLVWQLKMSDLFDGVVAIILGDFSNCVDRPANVINPEKIKRPIGRVLLKPKVSELRPLRVAMSNTQALKSVFGSLSKELGIPVFSGMPSGHGPGFYPLPMGADYRLNMDGQLSLLKWEWTG